MTDKKPRPARRRARKPDGKFQSDNPNTPQNEAWESVPVEQGLPKKKATTVAPKVRSTTTSSAGKYGKRSPITRPGANKITTTFH